MRHPDKYYQRFTAPKCEWCGSRKYLVVHHLDGKRQNQKRDNLITLCSKCHRKEHRGQTWYWKRREHKDWAEEARRELQQKKLEKELDEEETR